MLKNKLFLLFIFIFIFSLESADAYYVRYNETIISSLNSNQSLSLTNITDFNAQVYNETSLQFDGINDIVTINDTSILDTNETTISFWIKVIPNNSNSDIMRKWESTNNQRSWAITINTNGSIRGGFSNSGTAASGNMDSATLVNISQWVYIAFTFNLTNLTLYVNNVPEANRSLLGGIFLSTSNITIADEFVNIFDYNGSLDEFRLYNISLSASQIGMIYSSGLYPNSSINSTGLVMWLPIHEDNSSKIVYDATNYGNNGTISSATFASTTVLVNLNSAVDYIVSSIHGFINIIQNAFLNAPSIIDYNSTPIFINYSGFPSNLSIEIYSLKDSLIYYSNNTAVCLNINTCDNNINVTISNATNLFILDDFNLTEDINRQFSPVWISESSPKLKKIGSNITQNINFTSILNPYPKLCSQIKSVSERSNSGNFTRTLIQGIDYTCMSDLINISLQNVEYSTGSHEINLGYLGDGVCDAWEDGFSIDCNPASSPGGGNTGGVVNGTNNVVQLQQEENKYQKVLEELKINPYFKYVIFGVIALIIVSVLDSQYKKKRK